MVFVSIYLSIWNHALPSYEINCILCYSGVQLENYVKKYTVTRLDFCFFSFISWSRKKSNLVISRYRPLHFRFFDFQDFSLEILFSIFIVWLLKSTKFFNQFSFFFEEQAYKNWNKWNSILGFRWAPTKTRSSTSRKPIRAIWIEIIIMFMI